MKHLCALPSLGLLLLWSATAGAGIIENTSPERDVNLGRQMAAEFERTHDLSSTPALTSRVQRLGQMLVDAFPHKPYPYEFKVAALPDMNAFALPGGFIYIHEGLLNRVQDDGALAFILAHEMAHCNHRHWAAKVERAEGVGLVVSILAGVAGVGGSGGNMLAQMVAGLAGASYSREKERDADVTAVEYLWQAGLSPDGALKGMQELVDLGGHTRFTYFDTHPQPKDRLPLIQKRVNELKDKAPPVKTGPTLAGLPQTEPPPGELLTQPLLPLAVGNEWTYRQQGEALDVTYTLTVRQARGSASGVIYGMAQKTAVGEVVFDWATGPDRLWRRNAAGKNKNQWYVDCLLPLLPASSLAEGGKTCTCLGLEAISTPAGDFPEALHLRQVGAQGQVLADLWLARGVGLVKRVYASGISETLQRHRVAAPPGMVTAPTD